MKPRILLINPPIHDFTAYDFWVRPYGMLSVAGQLRQRADLTLFDFLDRGSPLLPAGLRLRSDPDGRGAYYEARIDKPAVFADIPRHWRRYGVPREAFGHWLKSQAPFDFVLIQTGMTYWYPGVGEVIEDLRRHTPAIQIALGGVYASLCPEHAQGLEADLVVQGERLDALWTMLGLQPRPDQPPLWEAGRPEANGVLKLADGCPLHCSYCAVSRLQPEYMPRHPDDAFKEWAILAGLGVKNVAFYDDALLHRPGDLLLPFLERVCADGRHTNFHTPNALHARFMTDEIARAMVRAGFRTFYLGFESGISDWHGKTGGKVSVEELAGAVASLRAAGAEPERISAYLLLGHPDSDQQALDVSLCHAHDLGIRAMLADYSPIPGTPDGETLPAHV